MTTNWHHSCHVRLGIRVEDFKPRKTTAELPDAPGFETFAEDAGFKGISLDIVPNQAHVTIENYRKASTARIHIERRRLPWSSRIIRQLQVQVFGGVVSADEVALAGALASPGRANEILIAPDEDPATGNSYELFRGFITNHRMIRRADEDFVELNATDLTSIFTTAEMYEDPLRGIPKSTPIDKVLHLLIYGDGVPIEGASKRFGLPGARGTVIVNDTGDVLPTLADIHPPAYFDSKGNARRSRSAGSTKKINFWDLMTDLCQSAGLWCYVRPGRKPILSVDGRQILPGAEIVISNPRTFFAATDATSTNDPSVRRFIVGYNIDSIEEERNYTGEAMPAAIEVRSYDPTIRQTRFARYPKIPWVNRQGGQAKGDRQEIKVQPMAPMSGPKVVETLCGMAIELFEQRARPEMSVTIASETTMSALLHAPSYLDGVYNPDTADMFFLRPGDTIEIDEAAPDEATGATSSWQQITAASREARTAEYIRIGAPPTLAAELIAAEDSPWVQHFYRVMKVDWDWKYPPDSDEGNWGWQVTGASYLDVRNAPVVLGDSCITGIAKG